MNIIKSFEEWLEKAKSFVEAGPNTLLWISPRKWHANETIYFIRDKKDLDKALSIMRMSDVRLEIMNIEERDVLAKAFPSVSLMDLLWDNPYLNIMAGGYDDRDELIVFQHASPFWEFISDKENRNKEFIFIKQPDWDNATHHTIK